VTGAELSQLEDCWVALLTPFPWEDLVAEALVMRGKILFGIGARLLGFEPAEAEPFGVVWSLEDAARHCSDQQSREFLQDRARAAIDQIPQRRVPNDLQPLTMFVFRRAYELLHGDRRGWHRIWAGLRYVLFGEWPR
jgi:phytoene synthase